jgi:hypothetical protein
VRLGLIVFILIVDIMVTGNTVSAVYEAVSDKRYRMALFLFLMILLGNVLVIETMTYIVDA